MRTTKSPKGTGAPRRLEAQLLGGLALRYDGRSLHESAFRRRKSLILLLRLLTSPGHRQPVDTVVELLWPEQDPEAGAHNLRTVLSEVRAALPNRAAPNPVVRLDATLALDPTLDLALDVDQFESAAAAGLAGDPAALQRALALYAGPLLPSLPFEEWALERRTTLARLHRQAALALAAAGEIAAEEQLRALLAEDPADEPAGQALMRLLGARGRRAEALRIYQPLVAALEQELGVAPSPETAALHAALLEPPTTLPGGAVVIPAPRPAEAPLAATPRHNLPAALSSFVGRAWERVELRQLLERTRLLTLTGPGGGGKTRLALTLAEERLASFPDGVWLVELAPVGSEAAVTQAVARVLGLREEPDRPVTDTLASYLAPKTALLLLDNCEHLLGACADLAERLLRACPHLRILATSRERLGLAGEAAWPVPPLSLPPQDRAAPIARLARAEAVQLFVERVRGVRPGFALTARNARAVEQVCRQLDGIPLALELAAARAGALTVEQLAHRLDDRFRLLTGGSRAALPRHQTLQASIDWSYELLDEAERTLLNRLSIFSGGWTLEAAETACAGDGIESRDVLDLLDSLVGKSLVQAEETDDGEARYRLLETVRHYGQERLAEAGESEMLRERHLDWCVALAEAAAPELKGAAQQRWAAQLEAEHDNLRAALSWSVQEGHQPVSGLRLAGALWRFWVMCGRVGEGRGWLERALDAADAAPAPTRAAALVGAGNLAHRTGDYERAGTLYGQSLALYRDLEDRAGTLGAVNGLGLVAWSLGDYEQAQRYIEETIALCRAVGDSRSTANALVNLGNIVDSTGDYRRARLLYEEALTLVRSLGDTFSVATILNNLGDLMAIQGDYEQSAVLHQESLAIRREMGDTTGIAQSLRNLGKTLCLAGDALQAKPLLEESLVLFRDLSDPRGLTGVLADLGNVAYLQGDHERAEIFHTEGLAFARRVGDKQSIAIALINLGRTTHRCGDVEQAVRLHREGLILAREIGANGEVAAGLEYVATVLASEGGAEQAARLFGAAEQLRGILGVAVPAGERAEHDQAVQRLRDALGERAFTAAWTAGYALSTEQAAALALSWGPALLPGATA